MRVVKIYTMYGCIKIKVQDLMVNEIVSILKRTGQEVVDEEYLPNENKACQDCKFMTNTKRCMHNATLKYDIVTGDYWLDKCENLRKFTGICYGGRFFKEKDNFEFNGEVEKE